MICRIGLKIFKDYICSKRECILCHRSLSSRVTGGYLTVGEVRRGKTAATGAQTVIRAAQTSLFMSLFRATALRRSLHTEPISYRRKM
jgi:hypothetical protein